MKYLILIMMLPTVTKGYPNKIVKCEIGDNIVNAIIMQETRNRNLIGDTHLKNDYSVGYAQVRVSTAKWLLKTKMKLTWNKVLISTLLNLGVRMDHLLSVKWINVHMARSYLQYICVKHRRNFKKTIMSYNVGPWAKASMFNTHGKKYFNEFLRFYR